MGFDVVTYALAKKKANQYTDYKWLSLQAGLNYRGSVTNWTALQSKTKTSGDAWSVKTSEVDHPLGLYACDGAEWIPVADVSHVKVSETGTATDVVKYITINNVEKKLPPVVSVSDTGTATEEAKYITVDGVEKKLAGSAKYIELSGWDTTDGWHDGGTLTAAQAAILAENELNYIWMNGMHRLDFRYRDSINDLATYSASDGPKTHVIEIVPSTKVWRYKHVLLQEKLIAGENITINTDERTINAESIVDVTTLPTTDIRTGVIYRLKVHGLGTLIDKYTPVTILPGTSKTVTFTIDDASVMYDDADGNVAYFSYDRESDNTGADARTGYIIAKYWDIAVPDRIAIDPATSPQERYKLSQLFNVDSAGTIVRYIDTNGVDQACYIDTWDAAADVYEYYIYKDSQWYKVSTRDILAGDAIKIDATNRLSVNYDNKTLIIDETTDKLRTKIGGWVEEVPVTESWIANAAGNPPETGTTYRYATGGAGEDVRGKTEFTGTFTGTINGAAYNKTVEFIGTDGRTFTGVDIDTGYVWNLDLGTAAGTDGTLIITFDMALSVHPVFDLKYYSDGELVHPIESRFVPIDNDTIIEEDGVIKVSPIMGLESIIDVIAYDLDKEHVIQRKKLTTTEVNRYVLTADKLAEGWHLTESGLTKDESAYITYSELATDWENLYASWFEVDTTNGQLVRYLDLSDNLIHCEYHTSYEASYYYEVKYVKDEVVRNIDAIGKTFNSNITVGHLASGTAINAGESVGDLLYRILYGSATTKTIYTGVSSVVPTSTTGLFEAAIPTAELTAGKVLAFPPAYGQYRVICCEKSIKLNNWQAAVGDAYYDCEFAADETTSSEVNIYYINKVDAAHYNDGKLYDADTANYKFIFMEA